MAWTNMKGSVTFMRGQLEPKDVAELKFIWSDYLQENALATVETGEDITIFFSHRNNIWTHKDCEKMLKLSLQIIGRNDLAPKLEIYIRPNNYDTQRGVEGQNIISDDEIKNIPLTKCEKLGRGAFATVYRYENKDFNVEIAMKQFDCFGNKRLVDSLHQEIQILSKLKHKRIVRYYGIRLDEDSVSILMEYLKGGSIHKLISDKGALCEKDVSKYCLQILEGLAYLHEMKIIHRDLKCANILLDDFDNCKLADFGISKDAENVRSMSGAETDCGTVYWKSPECIQGIKYGWKSDIWSFGCTVLEMLNKEPPNRGLSAAAAMWKIVQNEMDLHFPPGTSDQCILFTKLCLQKEPKDRPSAKELLGHSFISICND